MCCVKINGCFMFICVHGCICYVKILHVRFVSGYRQRLGHDLLRKDK